MEVAECSSRSRKKKKSAEQKGIRSMSASFSGGRQTKRLRRCEKIREDKQPVTDSNPDSQPKLKRSKLIRKHRTTRAERKAKFNQKILKKAGPKYWALVDMVKQRDKCYEGPEKSRAYRTGALLLKEARILLLYGRRHDAERHCKYALGLLADVIPLSEPAEPVMDPEAMMDYKLQTEYLAKTALEFYNEQNPGVEFELVEAICSNGFVHYGCWYHVNFMAKPKNINASDGGDSSQKLFFAELNHQIRDGESPNPFICRCSIVDPDNELRVLSSCGYCNPAWKLYHPVGQFECGLFCYSRRRIRII